MKLARQGARLVLGLVPLLLPGPTPTPAPAPTTPVNPDGSLIVNNPYDLQPLPPVAGGAPIYPRARGRVYFGVNDNSLWHVNLEGQRSDLATPDQVGAIAAGVGASFVRLELTWPRIEPYNQTVDKWRWDSADSAYRGLIARGVRPLWVIIATPSFAVTAAEQNTCDGVVCDAEPDPAHPEYAEQFGAELARRYPLAAGFEVRNEPNLPCDGTYQLAPGRLAATLKAFSRGARSTRPDMRILGGALAGCGGRPQYPADYAHQLIANYGVAPYISALSFHPYDQSSTMKYFTPIVTALENQLVADGHPELRLVISEVGASTLNFPLAEDRSQRYQDEFWRTDQDSRIDGFVAFNTIETGNHYGWLAKQDSVGKFQARRPYCDFRQIMMVTQPLPYFVRDCQSLAVEDATTP